MNCRIDRGWKPANAEERLLAFIEELILDVARTHPRITQRDVAEWLAAVAIGD